jgi:hypothetical protein
MQGQSIVTASKPADTQRKAVISVQRDGRKMEEQHTVAVSPKTATVAMKRRGASRTENGPSSLSLSLGQVPRLYRDAGPATQRQEEKTSEGALPLGERHQKRAPSGDGNRPHLPLLQICKRTCTMEHWFVS